MDVGYSSSATLRQDRRLVPNMKLIREECSVARKPHSLSLVFHYRNSTRSVPVACALSTFGTDKLPKPAWLSTTSFSFRYSYFILVFCFVFLVKFIYFHLFPFFSSGYLGGLLNIISLIRSNSLSNLLQSSQ